MPKGVSLDSDRRLHALIEHSSDAIALLTPEGIVTYASPSTERVVGYTADGMVGRNVLTLLHPDDLEEVRQQLTALLDHFGDCITLEFRLRHAGGTWRWMGTTLTNQLAQPEVAAVVCNYHDITLKKQGIQRRLQSEERYQVLVEQAGVGIFVTDSHGRLVEVNEMGCQLSGYAREEVLTRHVRDLVPEEGQAGLPAALERLRAGGVKLSQWRMKRKDGSHVAVGTTANQLSTGDLLVIVRDISTRMQARRELEELNRQLEAEKEALRLAKQEAEMRAGELEAIFEAMTEGVIVYDASGAIRYTNVAYRSLLELEEDADPSLLQLENRFTWLAVRDLQGRPLPKEQFASLRVLRGERLSNTNEMDFICSTRKGSELVLNTSGAPLRDPDGTIVGGVLVFRDVTRRRHLEQQLQYSELKLRSLVESGVLGVAVADLEGRIYESNDCFARMHGYSKNELLAETFNWSQLVPPEAHEALWKHITPFLSKAALPPFEWESLRKDGSRVPMLTMATLLDPERHLALVVNLDISDRKAAEQRKQEFLRMVNHELRTPLTAILGLIELALLHIKRRPTSFAPEAEELLGKLEQELRQAIRQVDIEARLVDDLLEVSRLEMHQFTLSSRRVNLVPIVQETVAGHQAACTRDFELALPPEDVVPVIADANRIGQVLTNYLTNALKYAPVDQVIRVRLEVTGTVARVSVCDQGPGLTPEQQQRVWERFYQVAVAGHRGPERGLGLGLAIARAIIEQHQGQVGVESAPGQGSTFWFTLPLSNGPIRA